MIKISSPDRCMGCHACYNACPAKCITMEYDSEGFLYPHVNEEKCINCNLCEKVCPVIKRGELSVNKPKGYVAYSKDADIRRNSSSGGMFYMLAQKILLNGGVVFAAAFDENFVLRHSFTESVEELPKYMGSKYVQSIIGDTYKQAKDFLLKSRTVLFAGTPCQIEGLKKYLRKDYDNLITIDIICHGVPSPLVWKKYLNHLENKYKSKATAVSFRDKTEGWVKFSLKVNFENGEIYRLDKTEDLYFTGFLKNMILRPSCYNCSFKSVNRVSDLTIADCWGVNNIIENYYDDKGTSFILVQSEKGSCLLNSIENIRIDEVDTEKPLKFNTAAEKSAPYNEKRDSFFAKVNNTDIYKLLKKFANLNILKIKRAVYKLLFGNK